ncbi:MAG: hypothetical protein ACI4C4_00375 [Lachnospiraceae bacterium]
MRKFQKQQIEEIIQSLHEMHRQIKRKLEQKDIEVTGQALNECQMAAIQVGETIEQTEGEGTETVGYLEQYCERVYQVNAQIQEISGQKAYKCLEEMLIKAENAIHHMPERTEIVFLPYKVSMWDSLESVWMAAEADPDCDAYVIPIPYYDKNSDGSFKEEHYEGNLYPDYVPVVHYNDYDFAQHRPDAIFIHNPYDQYNNVTSVHPFFYSKNLKKFTNKLVYIPYYATAGGMSEAQSTLPSYYYVDYIVIQAEKYRKYFDANLPEEKFLPLGSPKFDKVIRTCKNPPEPPASWKDKMAGKKVYFYNTSINGMLANTANFLKKMEYVFQCFANRNDVCLVWRPHPLLESTFESMRASYKPIYDALKKYYLESDFGIYDDTPEITDTIALCDAYIGDAGTSVTSLFGVVGKPLFILNNNIHTLPEEDDWKGVVYQTPFQSPDGIYHNKYCITQGNKLYYSPDDNLQYVYFCDLSEYAGGGYYSRAFDYEDKIYVLPNNAQHILVVSQNKRIRSIELENEVEQGGAFTGFWIYGDYAFLLPNRYSSLVRFNMKTEEIMYLKGISDFNIAVMPDGERIPAARWIWREKMYFMNPAGTQLMFIDMDTLEASVIPININRLIIWAGVKEIDGEDFWLIPYEGTVVTHWNMVTGETKNYDLIVEGIKSIDRRYKTECNQRIFGSMAFMDDEIIFSPAWGNKFVKLNPNTGETEEWESPFDTSAEDISPYIPNWDMGWFICDINNTAKYQFFVSSERKLYDIDLYTKETREVKMSFLKEEVYRHANGYGKESQWLQYCCVESVFNSIMDELGGTIHGEAFVRQRQIEEYAQINASPDGDCGEKIYRYVTKCLE